MRAALLYLGGLLLVPFVPLIILALILRIAVALPFMLVAALFDSDYAYKLGDRVAGF